jgi:hypothetical protein
MSLRAILRPKSIAVDTALVAAVLVGANLLFDRTHPGWTNLNPSPYLLLPILIGGRYGFIPGVIAGFAASMLVVVQQLSLSALLSTSLPASVGPALTTSLYLHASFFFTGALCGELFGWFRRERAQAEAQLDKLSTSVRSLDSNVRYLRGVKDELDRVVAARDGEVSALDTELRRLYAASAEDIPSEVLQFLKRQVRLAEAAIYSISTPDQPLLRLAYIGRDTHLPTALTATASPVVQLALDRNSLVTLPEILQQRDPPHGEHILIAAPLRDADGLARVLLVVTGLPFITFNAQSANLVALICDWAGEAIDLASGAAGRYRIVTGRGSQRIFTRDHFRHLLQLAFEAHERHRLTSSIVLFFMPGASPAEQSRFESALLGAVRTGDYAAELGRREPHLVVLLPLIGERGAAIFTERCRQFLKQSGPWPAEVTIRRCEFGVTGDVASVFAELDAP